MERIADQCVTVVVPEVQEIVIQPRQLGCIEKVVVRRQDDAPKCPRALEQLAAAERAIGMHGLLDVEVGELQGVLHQLAHGLVRVGHVQGHRVRDDRIASDRLPVRAKLRNLPRPRVHPPPNGGRPFGECRNDVDVRVPAVALVRELERPDKALSARQLDESALALAVVPGQAPKRLERTHQVLEAFRQVGAICHRQRDEEVVELPGQVLELFMHLGCLPRRAPVRAVRTEKVQLAELRPAQEALILLGVPAPIEVIRTPEKPVRYAVCRAPSQIPAGSVRPELSGTIALDVLSKAVDPS